MNQFAVTLVVILLPGIIAAIIADALTVHSRWDSFRYGLYSFILGTCSYLALQFVVFIRDIAVTPLGSGSVNWTPLSMWSAVFGSTPTSPSWLEVLGAAILSAPVAAGAAWVVNHKVINALGQSWNISTKYGDENLFSYYLNAKEIDWIYVRCPDRNVTYQGRIVSSSENDSIQELVLSEVSAFAYDDSTYLYSVPTLYLAREAGQFIIEAVPTEYLEKKP